MESLKRIERSINNSLGPMESLVFSLIFTELKSFQPQEHLISIELKLQQLIKLSFTSRELVFKLNRSALLLHIKVKELI